MRKKFQEQFNKVLVALGFSDRANKPKGDPEALSGKEWENISSKYKEMFKSDFLEDLNAAKGEAAVSEENAQAALHILGSAMGTSAEGTEGGTPSAQGDGGAQDNGSEGGEGEPNGTGANNAGKSPANAANTGEQLVTAAQKVVSMFQKVTAQATLDKPMVVVTGGPIAVIGNGDRSKYLFGIENSMFDMTKRWNQITVNPVVATSIPPTKQDAKAFSEAVEEFAGSLRQRYAYLHANNMLSEPTRLAAGEFSGNYDGIVDAKVGNQFVIRRQDALIARVLLKRDVTQYFPVRYGIQDHDLIFNAFFEEVSQAYQEGEIYKGGAKLEPEMGHVDDVMIKLRFGSMKNLERMYIGDQNKEGSDPIKWTMIEFFTLNSLETAQVEQNKRRIRGIYVKPEAGVAGSYLTAGTGLLYTLVRYYNEFKIKLHDDASYRSYTESDFLDAVQEFCGDVTLSVTEDTDLDNHVLYLNKLHQPWWIKNIRAKYGKDTDFSGPNGYLNVVPDTNIRIIWLPYLSPKSCLMFMQIPGNIQMLEYVPGEMLGMQMEQQMEMVRGWSTWKEGCSAGFVGRKFASKAALDANNYEWQQIFMNKPSVALAADATTIDATAGFWFETIANAAATALTDIAGAKAGVAYVIECAATANATTIAKAGKFAKLTAAYTPTAVGDYIMVILDSTGNFLELERRVGGTRTINAALQPNIPGVR